MDIEMKEIEGQSLGTANSNETEATKSAVASQNITTVANSNSSAADGNELRVKVDNLPNYFRPVQVKKFLQSHLPGMELRKLKVVDRQKLAFFSVSTEEELERAIALLDGAVVKGKNRVNASRAVPSKRWEPQPPSQLANSTTNTTATSHESNGGGGENADVDAVKKVENAPVKSATEIACPLAHLPYAEQLEWKQAQCLTVARHLKRMLIDSGVMEARRGKWAEDIVKKILPSPVTHSYRNKCEFTVGRGSCEAEELTTDNANSTGNCQHQQKVPVVVGFVAGKMSDRRVRIAPADDCPLLTPNTKAVVREFQRFASEFDASLHPYDEFERVGFWRMLTVRDFSYATDCMVIVTVAPYPPELNALVAKAKLALAQLFLPAVEGTDKQQPVTDTPSLLTLPRVTSLYWQVLAQASDEKRYEYLAGAPYVYERLLGARYRISPATFFQTNTRGAEMLYEEVAKALGLPNAGYSAAEVEALTPGLESPLLLLDICCGVGTIGISCVQRLQSWAASRRKNGQSDNQQLNNTANIQSNDGPFSTTPPSSEMPSNAPVSNPTPPEFVYGCLGIESVTDAVLAARLNVKENCLRDDQGSFVYVAGAAELLLKHPESLPLPSGISSWASAGSIVAVLDPPRAGVADRVVIACRRLEKLRRLVYVSCDPRAAEKNLVDLCRAESRRYQGDAFCIESIQPVDMFPLTQHFEWVVTLVR